MYKYQLSLVNVWYYYSHEKCSLSGMLLPNWCFLKACNCDTGEKCFRKACTPWLFLILTDVFLKPRKWYRVISGVEILQVS